MSLKLSKQGTLLLTHCLRAPDFFTPCAYCVRMICRRHLYMMYFGQPSSPRFYMVHQRGLVCVLLRIVPDSTRSFAGVSAATTVPMTFQLLKNCSLTLTIHYLNALSINQRTSYTPSLPRNLNNHTTCEKGDLLISCREDFRTKRT